MPRGAWIEGADGQGGRVLACTLCAMAQYLYLWGLAVNPKGDEGGRLHLPGSTSKARYCRIVHVQSSCKLYLQVSCIANKLKYVICMRPRQGLRRHFLCVEKSIHGSRFCRCTAPYTTFNLAWAPCLFLLCEVPRTWKMQNPRAFPSIIYLWADEHALSQAVQCTVCTEFVHST